MCLSFHFDYIAILRMLEASGKYNIGAVYVSGTKPKLFSILYSCMSVYVLVDEAISAWL